MDQSAYFGVPGQPKSNGVSKPSQPAGGNMNGGYSAPSAGAQSCYMGVGGNNNAAAASCYMPSPGVGFTPAASRQVVEVSLDAGLNGGSTMTALPGAGMIGGSTMTALPGAGMSGGSTMTALPGAGMNGGSTMTALPGGFSGGSTMTALGEMQAMADDTKTAIGGYAPQPVAYSQPQQPMGGQSVYCGVGGAAFPPNPERALPSPKNVPAPGGSVYFGAGNSSGAGMQSQYMGPKVSTLRNSFGQLTAAQATAEALLLSVFAFYFAPLVFSETEFLKNLANYFSIFLLICYDVCNYCHLLISINRLTAVALPLQYERVFSKTNTRRLIVVTWIISIATCIWLYGFENCHLYYDNEYWRLNFLNNTVCNTIVWYGDFVKDFATVFIIIVIDTITVCHVAAIRIRNSKNKQSKKVNESNLLKQACTQAFAFAIELVSYFILVNYFENRFVKYALTGYAWISLHSIDGMITIVFNKEFRNFKKLRAHTSEKPTSTNTF